MLQALLCGKMSSQQENSEDLFTSSVFGLLRHLSSSEGLFTLLSLAESYDGRAGACVPSACMDLTHMEFWPRYSNEVSGSTEPDIMIWARDENGEKHIFMIEVKLWSSKSSRPTTDTSILGDQLAREWWTLVSLCELDGARAHFVYLTSDLRCPRVEIREAEEEYSAKLPAWSLRRPFACFWLSWSKVASTFENSSWPALREISLACRKLGLDPFAGVHPFKLSSIDWAFSEGDATYKFELSARGLDWRFE